MPVLADLSYAEHALVSAEWALEPGERYAQAQLAALRVAAVVLALRARPARRRTARRADVWTVLARVAPEYAEWAGYFGLTQPRCLAVRAALAQRRTPPVTARQADDLLRDAQRFHGEVARRLGALDDRVLVGGTA